jgi:aspartyl protease family protein
MLLWALRTVFLWTCVGYAAYYGWENRVSLIAAAQQMMAGEPANRTPSGGGAVASNTITYRANHGGHVLLDAAVNGSSVHFLVDTGATLVTLTTEDARSAGLIDSDLRFTERMSTANGVVQMARVTLREIRLGQLTMEDVDAVVVDSPQRLQTSLLGMSFLKRLDGYEMHDGALTISW